MTEIEELVSSLVADLLLDGLGRLSFQSSNKHVVDYLPRAIADLLFSNLFLLAEDPVEIDIRRTDREPVVLQSFMWGDLRVIPFRASDEPRPMDESRSNRGTTGFASALRDYFAAGSDEKRLLVTVTDAGNETQKSAQDVLSDRALITRRGLVQVLRRRYFPDDTAAPRRVLDVLLENDDDSDWIDLVGRCRNWLEEVKGKPAKEQGRALPMLGPFLPDPREDYADTSAPRIIPSQKEQDKRRTGSSRLHDNVALRGFLEDAFTDPLRDPETTLSQVLESKPDLAKKIAADDVPGLEGLELNVFEGVQHKQRRKKIRYELDGIQVVGAQVWELLARTGTPLLVARANSEFQIEIPLNRDLDSKKDFPAVLRWSHREGKPSFETVRTESGANKVSFTVSPTQRMEIVQLSMLRGPRSLSNPVATLELVIYSSNGTSLVTESSRETSFETQAWSVSGSPEFQRFQAGVEQPVRVEGRLSETGDSDRDDEARDFYEFDDDQLVLTVVVPEITTEATEDEAFSLLGLAAYARRSGTTAKKSLREAAAGGHHMDAVKRLAPSTGAWSVDLQGGVRRRVGSPSGAAGLDDFGLERAVRMLLDDPAVGRLVFDGDWTTVRIDAELTATQHADALNSARASCFGKLMEAAAKTLPRSEGHPVPIPLLGLHVARSEIEQYVDAWTRLAEDIVGAETHRCPSLTAVLQMDTVRVVDSGGHIQRLYLLPTHPWVLGSILAFQDRLDASFAPGGRELVAHEVSELAPPFILEEWYVEDGTDSLKAADSVPFYPSFVSSRAHAHRTTHDYMSRIVANKLARYLRMHPHLRSERRALRIGFVNPGDGLHLLEGLRLWLKSLQEDRLRQLPMESIPNLEVFLFATGATEDTSMGAEFDQFFHRQVSASDEDTLRQALVARLRYRKRTTPGPQSDTDALHLCFVHGLLRAQTGERLGGSLDDWWDGGFGDGLLATPLRATRPGQTSGSLNSKRGIWIGDGGASLRSCLRWLLTLLGGQKLGTARPGRGLFAHHQLPDLQLLGATYENSDWVVHLDRELSLEMFSGRGTSTPTIIEYSDQEVPDTPGFDTITVTQHDQPYREQLHEILAMAGLDTRGQAEPARRSAERLLDDINLLSGSWALDFLLGSLADERYSLRLKGNLGAALAYRWLHRIEHGGGTRRTLETNVGRVLPVFVSLEELLRVTPAADLKLRDGLAYRFSNEYEADKQGRSFCDDLLVLYITPSVPGRPSRLFGRVVEVKFGSSAFGAREKATRQVRGTQELLQGHLSGGADRVDAPFRDKQLSLLLKAQLEQAVAMRAIRREDIDTFAIPLLSTNLATGNYTVEYTIGDGQQHLNGDVFLLSTDDGTSGLDLTVNGGARVLRIGSDLVRWLAFEEEDAPTLASLPPNTTPDLGMYRRVNTEEQGGADDQSIATPTADAPALLREVEASLAPETTPERRSSSAPETTPESEPSSAPETTPDEHPTRPPNQASNRSADAGGTWVGTEIPDVEWTAPVLETPSVGLKQAMEEPVKVPPYPDSAVLESVERLEGGLRSLGVELETPLSIREVDRGPRLLRVYARLAGSQSIAGVRKITEDLARNVGTTSPDLHVANVTARRAVGIDIPVPGLTYGVSYEELSSHPSFAAARHELGLGFCAGIDVTGRSHWVDLASMPHALVAGTTGSGKTVFLRNIILTLVTSHPPQLLQLRLSSTKPMDFRVFTQVPHMGGTDLAKTCDEAHALVEELVSEMERRMRVIDAAMCDDIGEYNEEHPDSPMPRYAVVLDEYAATVGSFTDRSERQAFEGSVQRIAQEARAAGLHLIVCMQRPDAKVITGNIKANVLHRFALKLPQLQDSRVILDEAGAETLLGQGDMLYKDANSELHRLQVPNLEKKDLKRRIAELRGPPVRRTVSGDEQRTCPKCGQTGSVDELFGTRRMKRQLADGTSVVDERAQSHCRKCRAS